ncbi:MAG: hypothetical protein ACE144_11400 [Thermodesulfobacteriota bacterium]
MIIPRGKARHQDLLTSFTDLPALLSTLKSEGFSGTIEIEFPENKGVLFIDTGEIINAEVNAGGVVSRKMIGQEAAQYLLALSKQKDGVLNVYQLLPEQTAIIASNLNHEIIFKELSTDFTRFDRLLLKLREEKHYGFIEVLTKDHQPMGVLFLHEGEPIEMFTLSTSSPSLFGRKSIPMFVENAVKEGALLNVYRSSGQVTKKEGAKIPDAVPMPKEAEEVTETEGADHRAREEITRSPIEKIAPPEEKKNPFEDKKIPIEEKKVPKKEAKESHPEEGKIKVSLEDAGKTPREEPPVKEEKDERQAFILILQEILSKTERLVDEGSQKGKFLIFFKKSLLEKTNKYPFLDPFDGEFDYRNGILSFKGDAKNSELAEGVVDCLRAALSKIEKELSKNKTLPLKLRLEIESIVRSHIETVKRMGLESVFSPFCQ